VVAVILVTPPVKVQLCPDDGAVKVTIAPLIRLLLWSFTVAIKGEEKAVLIAALCDEPLVAVMLADVELALANPPESGLTTISWVPSA
jgi:hypothetical protein